VNYQLRERQIPGFVTLFLGVLDLRKGSLAYASAGHPNAMVRSTAGTVTWLEAASAPLGVFIPWSWKTGSYPLKDVDLLLLYTDGVIEARQARELFGQERLSDALARWSGTSPEQLPQAIVEEALAFSDGVLADDLAILALSVDRSFYADARSTPPA